MKKFISIITIIATLFVTTNAFALPNISEKVKTKAETNFNKLYASIEKDADVVKIQKLKTGLKKLTGKQPIYQELAPLQEGVKILILKKIEELNTKNPTTYSGCNKSDVAIGKMVWSSCNIGSTIAGTGEISYGNYFAFGTSVKVEDLDRKSYNTLKRSGKYKWNEGGQNVCFSGYHIPSLEEFKELAGYFSCKLSTGVSYDKKNCGALISNKLLLPGAGYYNNFFTPYGFRSKNTSGYNGIYWTSSVNTGNNGWQLGFRLDSNDRNYGQVGISANTGEAINGLSVRCVKD